MGDKPNGSGGDGGKICALPNPTQKSATDPGFQLEFHVIYNPVTGNLQMTGSGQVMSDPLVFFGLLALAERAYDRTRQKPAETSRIHLPGVLDH